MEALRFSKVETLSDIKMIMVRHRAMLQLWPAEKNVTWLRKIRSLLLNCLDSTNSKKPFVPKFFFDWDLIVFQTSDLWHHFPFVLWSLLLPGLITTQHQCEDYEVLGWYWVPAKATNKSRAFQESLHRTCRSARLSLSNLSGIPAWWDLQGWERSKELEL